MNFDKFMEDLAGIQKNPNSRHVTVRELLSGNVEFTFKQDVVIQKDDGESHNEAYYFPLGIVKILVAKQGGSGVVYVYTTAEQYPHLTIPAGGENVHWTDKDQKQGGVVGRAPTCIIAFLKMY